MVDEIHLYQTDSYTDSSVTSSGADLGAWVSSLISGDALDLAFGVAPGCISGTCTCCSGSASVRPVRSVTSLLLEAGA